MSLVTQLPAACTAPLAKKWGGGGGGVGGVVGHAKNTDRFLKAFTKHEQSLRNRIYHLSPKVAQFPHRPPPLPQIPNPGPARAHHPHGKGLAEPEVASLCAVAKAVDSTGCGTWVSMTPGTWGSARIILGSYGSSHEDAWAVLRCQAKRLTLSDVNGNPKFQAPLLRHLFCVSAWVF